MTYNGAWLKDTIEEMGFTPKQFANLIGINSKQTIYHWINGVVPDYAVMFVLLMQDDPRNVERLTRHRAMLTALREDPVKFHQKSA